MGPFCAPKGKLVHLDEETLPMAMDGKLEAEMVWVCLGRGCYGPLTAKNMWRQTSAL